MAFGAGIVSYWGEAKKQAENLLGIPADHELVCLLKIGVPGEEGTPRKRRPEFSCSTGIDFKGYSGSLGSSDSILQTQPDKHPRGAAGDPKAGEGITQVTKRLG